MGLRQKQTLLRAGPYGVVCVCVCVPPEDLPHPGIESEFPLSPALAGGFFTSEPPGKPPNQLYLKEELYKL